ncbi:MAG TPA: hypothetical protein VF838_09595 [Trebonia sp.]
MHSEEDRERIMPLSPRLAPIVRAHIASLKPRRPSRAPARRHRVTGISPQANPGSWIFTLPGGQQLAVRFDVVPTFSCEHRYQVSSYLPGERLRRLVQVRDYTCTRPPCSRPARESDFEHAVPYDKGGIDEFARLAASSLAYDNSVEASG